MIKPFEVVCLEEDLDATRGVVMLLNKAKNWHVMYVSISQESKQTAEEENTRHAIDVFSL